MSVAEILNGESVNVEYKARVPEKSLNYMKTVVAFANGFGGRLVFGVADGTREIVGVDEAAVFYQIVGTGWRCVYSRGGHDASGGSPHGQRAAL